jgi:hypothetical protein
MINRSESAKYEFSDTENSLMSGLSGALKKLGLWTLAGGLLFVVYLLVSFIDPFPILKVSSLRETVLAAVDYALWVCIALVVVYVSITIMRLSHPIRLIAETRGADVHHLMEFIAALTGICRMLTTSLIVICIIMLASLALAILVF